MKLFDLLNIFMRERDRRQKFKKLKEDPERAPKVVRYGVSAIVMDIIAIALVVLCLFTFETITSSLLTNAGVVVIVTALIWFAAMTILIVLPVGLIISALISSIYQLKINKKAIGWISLVLTILTLGGSIFLFLSLI